MLDRDGAELAVGDSVRLAGFGHMPPAPITETGTVTTFTREQTENSYLPSGVEVEWPDEDTTFFDWYPAPEDRCPDLLKITGEDSNG